MSATYKDFQGRIEALLPELESRNSEMEAVRHLPNDLAQKMAKAGLFRLITPKSFGGFELPPQAFMDCVSTVAKVNASAAWCVMIACTNTLSAAYLPVPTAVEIFSDPMMITGGIFAPMGRAIDQGETYLLSGRWQWGSGSVNTQWMACGAMIEGADKAEAARMFFFPTSQAELIDTWHVAGLKGTGSGDIAVKNIEIPKDRSVALATDTPVETGALYIFPPFGLLGIGVASVAYGNALGAIESFKILAVSKKNSGSRRTLSEQQNVRIDYAKAAARLRAAKAYLDSEIKTVWDAALRDGKLSISKRADLRLACSHMTRVSADVCRIVYEFGGGSALFLSSDLQRRFRDAHAITQHIVTAPSTFDLVGRLLFDLPTNSILI